MGLEYISQPQVFLSPITAAGGFQNGLLGSLLPPLYTSFFTWTTSTASTTAITFPLTGIETLTDRSGSFIVTVGGVLQSPYSYTVSNLNRTITFNTPVNTDTEVLVTQIGTVAVSAENTLTTTVSAMSGNGVTPFRMQFTNGLLTGLSF
jgi:hypothetical protein